MELCACGSNKEYAICCEPFLTGTKIPATPEQLMRSRYTAYTKANIDYIERTMKSPASDNFDAVSAKKFATDVEWLKLEVFSTSENNNIGFVEFHAHFSQNGTHHAIKEKSEFHLIDGHWYYVDGIDPKHEPKPLSKPKANRNDPCICGSNRKYKKCCGML